MDRNAIIEKMRKVLALATQGVGGEKLTATRQLDAMLTKYGIKREELEGESKRLLRLKYRDHEERKILIQVLVWALESYEVQIWRYPNRGRELGVEVTEAQRVQIMVAYGVYCREYAKIKKNMLTAFFARNELFAPADGKPSKKISDEERRAIQKLMQGIDKTHIQPRLTHDLSQLEAAASMGATDLPY